MYSGDELVYDQTMDDWRTHKGMDIACEIGQTVQTVAPGQVSEIYFDEMMGHCVAVVHADGIISRYYGLEQNSTLKVGDELVTGDPVGTAGNTVLAESAQDPHIHFEMWRDGASIDPMSLLEGMQ